MLKKYVQYLKNNPQNYWFKRKLFGWGWTPATWQGWLVTVIYVSIVLVIALTVDESITAREMIMPAILLIGLLTLIFIYIAYKKGEKPKWQWGSIDQDK